MTVIGWPSTPLSRHSKTLASTSDSRRNDPTSATTPAPTGFWSVSDTTQLLIELKTGVHRSDARIIKSELDQASGHINWHRENYGADCTAVSILVHPSRFYDPLGTPAPNTVVLEQAVVDSIRERVLTFARAIAVGNNWTSVDAVKQHLIANNLVGRNALTYQAPSPEPSAAFVLNPHSEQARAAERARQEELARAAEEGNPGVQDAGETPTEPSDAPHPTRHLADRD